MGQELIYSYCLFGKETPKYEPIQRKYEPLSKREEKKPEETKIEKPAEIKPQKPSEVKPEESQGGFTDIPLTSFKSMEPVPYTKEIETKKFHTESHTEKVCSNSAISL